MVKMINLQIFYDNLFLKVKSISGSYKKFRILVDPDLN
jgi:hypothetical protein